MNNLKYAVLACAVVGLVGAFLPYLDAAGQTMSFFEMRNLAGSDSAADVYLTLAGFAAALVAAAIAVAKPPIERWQATVAVVGFAWVIIRFREFLVKLITDGAIGAKLMGISAIAGVIFAILCVAKPETAR